MSGAGVGGGAEPSVTGERRQVVIADRDTHVCALLAHFLGSAGYWAEIASDGTTALAMVQAARPALLITEILLPKFDGLALCRAVKGNVDTQATKVVIFSILAARDRARHAGADVFLLKPFNESKMDSAIHTILGIDPLSPVVQP